VIFVSFSLRMIVLLVDRIITDGQCLHGPWQVAIVNDKIDKIVKQEEDISGFLKEPVTLIRLGENSSLLPGFIDCHVHLSIFTDDYQIHQLRMSSADKALKGLVQAQGLLQAGFTTVRSAGDADQQYPSFSIRKAIDDGLFVGPRICGAGHYISVTGGGGDLNFLSSEHCRCCPSDGMIVDGPHAMCVAVRNEIKSPISSFSFCFCFSLSFLSDVRLTGFLWPGSGVTGSSCW
jgi:imidazolonepropionase-like amidohydrolase